MAANLDDPATCGVEVLHGAWRRCVAPTIPRNTAPSSPHAPATRRVDARRLQSPSSDRDPLDLVQRDLIAAPVVEPGRAGRLVVGHLLRDLQLPPFAGIGDAGGAESVAADSRADAGRVLRGAGSCDRRPPATSGGPTARPVGRLAERKRRAVRAVDAGAVDVVVQLLLQVVVAGHVVQLAALLVQPHPAGAGPARTRPPRACA